MTLFTTDQIRKLDALTIQKEQISSIQLMNRASKALFNRLTELIPAEEAVLVVAGPGNNGGDALAVSRFLLEAGYTVRTLLCQPDARVSRDTLEQLIDLQQTERANLISIDDPALLSTLKIKEKYLIDGLFGTGLNRPVQGYFARIIEWINRQKCIVFSIDLPSGLHGEDNRGKSPSSIVHANKTLGLQFPRLAFLFPENEPFIGNWELLDIGIPEKIAAQLHTPYSMTTAASLKTVLRNRSQHAHKGTFGSALLVAGSPEMTGAAILSLRGALRSGAGLVHSMIPAKAIPVIQTAVPEAIVHASESGTGDLTVYGGIGVGPGIGLYPSQSTCLVEVLKFRPEALVLDADALNLLAARPDWMKLLPANSILTPHPKEFDRLAGSSSSAYERLMKAIDFAVSHKVYIVLKGAYTACISPNGHCAFNTTGNPGMATGGSGDVLTGIIVSLLAQGYSHLDACRLGVFIHGLSGDLALTRQSQESLVASDLAENLGAAFKYLNETEV